MSPVLSLVLVVPAITRSVLIKETIAQYSESDIGCAGLQGGEYTCTSAVSTTFLLIQCYYLEVVNKQYLFLNKVVDGDDEE